MKNIAKAKEVQLGLMCENDILRLFSDNACISYIHHKEHPMLIGPQMLLKVNTNIGVSDVTNLDIELRKLKFI